MTKGEKKHEKARRECNFFNKVMSPDPRGDDYFTRRPIDKFKVDKAEVVDLKNDEKKELKMAAKQRKKIENNNIVIRNYNKKKQIRKP